MKLIYISMILGLMLMTGVMAVEPIGVDFTDSCYVGDWANTDGNISTTNDLRIYNTCVADSYIEWNDSVDLTILGNVTDGEVEIGPDYMYVDSVARPDLDFAATLHFSGHSFAVAPIVLKDGILCASSCTDVQYVGGAIEVDVTGFSNYSLVARRDFEVFSDQEPELDAKVYQTIDLGASNRGTEFACVVQIFGRNDASQWVLVQTNPERKAIGNVFGDPDTNQPESLGYFPTKNGVANTYFRDHRIHGYNDFELVVQCTSNSTKLVYEESISTRYLPASRALVSRGVWLTDGTNAFYLTVWVIGGLFALWIGGMVWRRSFGG